MKIYFREPTPCTSGYGPILINYELTRRQKKNPPQLAFNYYDNILSKSRFIKNTFDKLVEISGMKDPDEWEYKRYEEIKHIGYVYFLQNGDLEQVKIGWAKNPQDRKKQLQTGNPNKLQLIAIKPCSDKGIERFLHHKFKKYRMDFDNEWFRFSRAIKEYIEDPQNALLLQGAD